jgi:hypothetical protein
VQAWPHDLPTGRIVGINTLLQQHSLLHTSGKMGSVGSCYHQEPWECREGKENRTKTKQGHSTFMKTTSTKNEECNRALSVKGLSYFIIILPRPIMLASVRSTKKSMPRVVIRTFITLHRVRVILLIPTITFLFG